MTDQEKLKSALLQIKDMRKELDKLQDFEKEVKFLVQDKDTITYEGFVRVLERLIFRLT